MGKSITAVILAGGKGERLKPITEIIPKPMVKVGGKPILEHIINLLVKNDITDIVISLCYKPKLVKEYFKNGRNLGAKISYRYENENQPLGTAGAVAKLRYKIKSTFIVAYGDILRELDVKKLLGFHFLNKGIGTICVYNNKKPDPKSLVLFNNKKKITSFSERPTKVTAKKVWSNASFYVFEPEIFTYLAYKQFADFGKDIFPKVLADNKKMFAYKHNGYFCDVGDLEKYKKANEEISFRYKPHDK